jgi:hypothetical protein
MEPTKKELTAQEQVLGKTTEFISPSGGRFVIREQNGDDDDLISNQYYAKNGNHLNHFIAAIVVETDTTPTGKLTAKDVLKMKIRDKYALLIKSRCFSLGPTISFEYDWGSDNGGKVEYTDDLSKYIFDYSNPEFPMVGDEDYFEYRIRPYIDTDNPNREFELSSGKRVRYEYLNGESERYLLELPPIKLTKNAELKARNIHQCINNEWHKVQSFAYFNGQDMKEIRDDVKLYDPETALITELENPKTGEIINYPIILAPDFFFPGEI